MKKIIISTLILLLVCTAQAGDFTAKYVRNYDGDTITVDILNIHDIFGDNIPIRVHGIDTPEKRGKCENEKLLAEEAKQLVYNIMRNSDFIYLKNCIRGKYFRLVCDVYVGDISVSEELFKANLGVEYYGKTKIKNWCE